MELDSALQRQEFITSVPDFGKESSETLLTVKRIEAMMLQYREGSSSILSSTALGSGLPVGRDDQLKTESSKAQAIQSYYQAAQSLSKEFGEFRDHECVIPFSMEISSEQSYDATVRAISKWLSILMDILTKETYRGYSTNVPDSDCRLFFCINMVLGFHAMSEFLSKKCQQLWNRHSQEFVRYFQQRVNESLEYYMSKYPSHAKILVPKEVESLMQTVNKSNIPVFNLFKRLKVALNPFRYFPRDYTEGFALNFNFRKDIRNLINACIQESKNKFDEFQELMLNVFQINVREGDYLRKKPIPGHKIGMKFKRNMPLIPNSDANGPTIEINSSEVLRVLIKWIEEIDDFIENPETHILLRSNLEPFVIDPMYRDGWVEFLSEEAKHRLTDQLIALREKLKMQGEWHSDGLNSVFHHLTQYVRAHKDQFDFLPKNTIKTGMSVSLLDAMTTQTAMVYVNRMLGLLYDALCRAFPKGNKFLHQETARRLELVPFSVRDLLRAQCYGDIHEMRQVINNLSEDERVTIVRVKNRLSTPNHDFLINFTFKGCQLICELQVGLDLKEKVEHKSEERKGFSHFLYELSRSKFGPLVEAALIVNNVSEMGRYFRKKTKPCRRLGEIKFDAEMGSDFQLEIENFSKLDFSANFFCSRCLQPKYAHRSFQPGWRMVGLQQYLCAKCIYDNLPAKYQPVYAIGGKQGSFFRVCQPEQFDKEPQYCIVSIDPLKYGSGSHKFYSSMNIRTQEELSGEQITSGLGQKNAPHITRLQIIEIFPDKFFECFQINSNTFFQKSIFKGKLLFELAPLTGDQRIELIHVTARCESELEVLLHLAGKVADIGKISTSEQEQVFLWSALLPVNRTYQQTAVCLVDPTRKALLAIDFVDKKRYQIDRSENCQSATQDKLKRLRSVINYEKSGYDEEVFIYLQYGKDVEELNLNENNFRTTDFLDFPNLKRLSLRLNRIDSLQVSANKLDYLVFLDLCGNNISHIKFEEINLPMLKTLLLNFNYIGSVDFGSNSDNYLPCLERFEINDNLLTNFDIEVPLPRLQYLLLNNNKTLDSLIVSGQPSLIRLDASCCCLSKFWIEGEFPYLQWLSLMANNLSEVAVQDAIFPKLQSLYLCYNRIENFNLCAPCPSLKTLDISFNNLKSLVFSDIPEGQAPRELKNISVYSTELSGQIKLGSVKFSEQHNVQVYFYSSCTVDIGEKTMKGRLIVKAMDLQNDSIGKLWKMSYDKGSEQKILSELFRIYPDRKQELKDKYNLVQGAFQSYVRTGKDGLEAVTSLPDFDLVSSAVEIHSRGWYGGKGASQLEVKLTAEQIEQHHPPPAAYISENLASAEIQQEVEVKQEADGNTEEIVVPKPFKKKYLLLLAVIPISALIAKFR